MAAQTEAIRQLVRKAIAEARGAEAPPSAAAAAPAAPAQAPPVRIPIVLRDGADGDRLARLIASIAATPELAGRLKSGAIGFDVRLASQDGAAEGEARAAFDRFFEAFNSGDFDRVWATVTEDFEWRLPSGPGAPYTSAKGRTAFRDAYTKRWAFLKHFNAVNEIVFVSGDRVYQHYRVSGTGPDGTAVDFTGLDFYIVRDGRIALKDAYNKSVQPGAGSTAGAGAPSVDIANGVVTERKVAEAARLGTRLVVGRRAVVTPLARDRARALGLTIERSER